MKCERVVKNLNIIWAFKKFLQYMLTLCRCAHSTGKTAKLRAVLPVDALVFLHEGAGFVKPVKSLRSHNKVNAVIGQKRLFGIAACKMAGSKTAQRFFRLAAHVRIWLYGENRAASFQQQACQDSGSGADVCDHTAGVHAAFRIQVVEHGFWVSWAEAGIDLTFAVKALFVYRFLR